MPIKLLILIEQIPTMIIVNNPMKILENRTFKLKSKLPGMSLQNVPSSQKLQSKEEFASNNRKLNKNIVS